MLFRLVTLFVVVLLSHTLSAHAQTPPTVPDLSSYDEIYLAMPADEIIRRAVDGNVLAQHELGNRLAQGNGVPRNDSAAAYWFSLAAARGFPGSPSLDALPTVPVRARTAVSESLANSPTASLAISVDNDALTTTLDASGSMASAPVFRYIWSIENADGSPADVIVDDVESTQITFTEAGIYYITLTILDATGRIDHITEILDLSEPPLVDEYKPPVYDGELEAGESLGPIECVVIDDTQQEFGDVTDNDWRWWFENYTFSRQPQDLSTGLDGNRAYLRQRLIPNSIGSPRVLAGRNLDSARTYRLTQSLYFEPDFDWGGTIEGGKVGFGLGGGTAPSGGQLQTDGFTLRFMWRGNRDGTARIIAYSYAADRSQNLPYGDSLNLQGFEIPVGEWFDITMEVKTNSTTHASDGTLRAWVNGELLLQKENILWQSSGSQPVVQKLSYATFYGGNDVSWAPAETTYIRFADVCWAPVIAPTGSIVAEISPQPTIPLDEAVRTVRGKVIESLSNVEVLLPSEDFSVNTVVYSALEDTNAALAGARWSDNNSIPANSSAVNDLTRAAETLSMVDIDTRAVDYVQGQTEINAQLLIDAARTLTDTVRLQVGDTLVSNRCNTIADTAACSSASYQLSRADILLEQSALPELTISEQRRLIDIAWSEVKSAAVLQ